LRAHAEDIPQLVEYFLAKLAVECRKSVRLTLAAMRRLQAYSWPGNVRQLRAVLENALVMADSELLDANAFPLTEASAGEMPALPINLETLERWAIPEALKRTRGNKTAAAEMLGITRETLGNKLKKFGMAAKDE
jgi:DNA-binding NtrC family response regulator